MRRLLALSLLSIAAFAAAPSAAQAALVGSHYIEGGDIVFAAGPGEANRVTVTGQADAVIFEDAGAPIDPGQRCTALTPNRVSCERSSFVIVELEDGDDEVTTAGTFSADTFVVLEGDQGSDTIRGQVASYSIDGGTGTDRLFGGSRTNFIDAVDVVRRGEFGEVPDHNVERDEVTCVAQSDNVNFRSVRVDSSDATSGPCPQVNVYMRDFVLINGTDGPDILNGDGPPSRVFGLGGNDQIVVENANPGNRADGGAGDDTVSGTGLLLGGTGNDTVFGTNTAVRLDGQAGDDSVRGGSRADSLAGGDGADDIRGGGGNDLIRSRGDGTRRDRVRCGAGRDHVIADRRDSVASDCEVVSRG